MKIIAIDPGKKGAIALVEYRNIIELIDTPLLGDKYDYKRVYDTLQDWKLQGAVMTVIEQQQAVMSRNGEEKGRARESPKTGMQIGLGVGMWETCLTILDISFEYITSSKWTKDAKAPKYKPSPDANLSKSQIDRANKKLRCEYASQLYPAYAQQFFGPNGGAIDGRADCVLIAEGWFRANMNQSIAA